MKNPKNTEQHEENNMWCISLQNKIFHSIHMSPTKNIDKDNQEITIKWLISPVLENAVIELLMKSYELHREFKNYQPISNF